MKIKNKNLWTFVAHLWTFVTKAQREAQTKNIYDYPFGVGLAHEAWMESGFLVKNVHQ